MQNKVWACFCVNVHIWDCFFGFASLLLYLICLLFSCFLNFPTKGKLGLIFSVKLPILGLFTKLLACFYKITWNHCLAVYSEV